MKKELMTTAVLSSMLLTACTTGTNLPKPSNAQAQTNINYQNVNTVSYDEKAMNEAYIKFALNMYNRCQAESDGNMMVSPASVMFALDMAAAGANGDTLNQIMALFGGENDPEAQFAYAGKWMDKINHPEEVEFHVANSFWMNEKILGNSVNDQYVEFIKNTFNSEITSLPFDDKTPSAINKWIDKNTKGMIKKAIDTLGPDTSDVIVNAICFDGKWEKEYEEEQVVPGVFKKVDGQQDVDYLVSKEFTYLESEAMTGFMKYYEGSDYAFMAMLPKDEKVTITDFASNLSGDEYINFWNSRTTEYDVYTKIPEFTSEYDILLNQVLASLGMKDAFNPDNADFKGMADLGDKNIFISSVFHKSFIQVDRKGTKAAAVTVITKDVATAMMDEPEYKEVFLDRPFAYAIVDAATGAPIFIGTVSSVTAPS